MKEGPKRVGKREAVMKYYPEVISNRIYHAMRICSLRYTEDSLMINADSIRGCYLEGLQWSEGRAVPGEREGHVWFDLLCCISPCDIPVRPPLRLWYIPLRNDLPP